MPTFYVHHDVEAFEYECREVVAANEREAAKCEADLTFDEGDVDPMRPVEVIVAKTRSGAEAKLYRVERTVIIEHNIISEQEISIESDDKVDHDDEE